jgi:hypothetical protein
MKTAFTGATVCGVLATASLGSAADMPVKAPPRAPTQASAPAWTLTVSSEARYYSWQSNRGFPASFTPPNSGQGAELYVPYAAQLVGTPADNFKVDIVGRGGWVWARQSTAGLTGEVATTTDTVASGTVTYLGLRGIQPFAALSTNIPTGRSELLGTAANARMDPDLVDIANFGEGFNVGPTAGFNLPISSSLVMTPSAGYTWRNSYDRENSLDAVDPTVQRPTRINPGDVFTAADSITYQSEQLAAQIVGSVSLQAPTIENGVPLYRGGARYLLTGTWSYTWPQAAVTTLTASASHANRNDVLFLGAPALVKEAMNTNSNLYRVGVQHLIPVGRVTFGPTASFLYRDNNEYDTTTLQFVPAKDRWAAGGLVRFGVTDTLTFNARAERVWTRENENPAPGDQKFSVLANGFVPGFSIPVISSTGWQVAIGTTGRF